MYSGILIFLIFLNNLWLVLTFKVVPLAPDISSFFLKQPYNKLVQEQCEILAAKKIILNKHLNRTCKGFLDPPELIATNPCPPSFNLVGNECLHLSPALRLYQGAVNACSTFNSSLISIESEEKWNQTLNYLQNGTMFETDHELSWWTSARQEELKDDFYWSTSDRPLTFTKWCEGEPIDFDTNKDVCVGIKLAEECWSTRLCSKKVRLPFICEKKAKQIESKLVTNDTKET